MRHDSVYRGLIIVGLIVVVFHGNGTATTVLGKFEEGGVTESLAVRELLSSKGRAVASKKGAWL
tara:strand:- start:61 stop:252 length:192 start_codon:yes stop_codon:yes gene_type:complete